MFLDGRIVEVAQAPADDVDDIHDRRRRPPLARSDRAALRLGKVYP
jgi:hypothetical protein